MASHPYSRLTRTGSDVVLGAVKPLEQIGAEPIAEPRLGLKTSNFKHSRMAVTPGHY